MVLIRAETAADVAQIRDLNEQAFGQPGEAKLVDALRPWISLVAVNATDQVVGHILFTPISVESEGGAWSALGLAPMAVLPDHQRRGIGSTLVRAGLEACRDQGHTVVFVLGHPQFYPRFGFKAAPPLGLRCKWDVPADVFMVAELEEQGIAGRTGLIHYDAAFDGV